MTKRKVVSGWKLEMETPLGEFLTETFTLKQQALAFAEKQRHKSNAVLGNRNWEVKTLSPVFKEIEEFDYGTGDAASVIPTGEGE